MVYYILRGGYESVGSELDASSRSRLSRAVALVLCTALIAGALVTGARRAAGAADVDGSAADLDADGCVRTAARPFNASMDVGFVFAAAGTYAHRHAYRCIAAMETLVRVGGWHGPIYLLTHGGEPCFDAELLRRTTGNPHIHVVGGAFDLMHNRAPREHKPRFKYDGRAKALKALMFDVIERWAAAGGGGGTAARPHTPPPVLIFHDCDKVIARPGCIEGMFTGPGGGGAAAAAAAQLPLPQQFGPQRQMLLSNMEEACIRGSKARCGDGIHTGVVALHTKWSRPLVHEWARRQMRSPKSYDRNTLWEAWNSSVRADGTHAWTIGNISDAFRDRMWNKDRPLSCINHVSGGRCHANGPHAARRLMRKLCIRSEYPPQCTETRRKPGEFALGWCGGWSDSPAAAAPAAEAESADSADDG